jgi:hypothetical protein
LTAGVLDWRARLLFLRVKDPGALPAVRTSLFFSISVVLRGQLAWELVTAVKAGAPRQDLWTGQGSGSTVNPARQFLKLRLLITECHALLRQLQSR